MSDTQAIKPSFFQSLPTLVKQEQAKEKGLTEEEQALYALSVQDGWVILREYAQSLIDDLSNSTESSMAQGMSLEEIGRNAVVSSLAKGVIERILLKVDDAKEVYENRSVSK